MKSSPRWKEAHQTFSIVIDADEQKGILSIAYFQSGALGTLFTKQTLFNWNLITFIFFPTWEEKNL